MGQPSALDENVQTIKQWEQAALEKRTRAEQVGEWVARTVASGPVIAIHALWFVVWATVNSGLLGAIRPFDPYPFPLLTMTVSLEAILLSLLLLARQNRFAVQSEKRAHLDLQINLLTEREMTAVLRLLQDVATHLDIPHTQTAEQIDDLARHTDIHKLATDAEGWKE